MDESWRDEVVHALSHACSQEPSLISGGEGKLKLWETQPGFYSTLMAIFQTQFLDINIRWLAILYIKNGVDRYWRKTAPHALSEEEKSFIKQHLVLSFHEPVDQLATQVAVLISKIIRVETRDWPELFPLLLKEVQSLDPLHQERTLLILNRVIKMLASKRLGSDKQLFRELTSNIFGHVMQVWQTSDILFVELYTTKDMRVLASLELSILTLKVLRKLICYGYKEIDPASQPMCLLQALFEKIAIFLQYRRESVSNHVLIEKLEKYLNLQTKVLIDTQEHLPLSFVPLIERSLQLCYKYVFTSQGQGLVFQTFALQCCKLMKGIVKCTAYQPPKEIKECQTSSYLQKVLKAHQIKMAFFTPAVLTEIIHQLVTRFFLLTPEDLQNWELDPEDFVNEDVGDSWKYQLRQCTEVLFLSILSEFRSTVTPVITDMIQVLQGSNASSDDSTVLLQRDAVYTACGLASYHLFDEVDFDKWFTNQLLQELGDFSSRNKILRRRIMWMTGQWINVKFSRANRPLLYHVLLQLMTAHEDLVVRLTAANSLKIVLQGSFAFVHSHLPENVKNAHIMLLFCRGRQVSVRDYDVDFILEDFLQFLEGSFVALFHLLKSVQECDTKMRVLHVLSLLIERVGDQICPFASSLSQYLPVLWQESTNHNMLQCAIVSTMTHLVEGLGASSNSLYPFLLPVIQLGTDLTKPQHVYLMEDALELWQNVVINASQMTPELLQLFASMPSLLDSQVYTPDLGSDNLRTCFAIIESYVLFNEWQFFETYGEPLVGAFAQMLGDLKPEGGIVLSRVIEAIVKISPTDGAQRFSPVLMKILHLIWETEQISDKWEDYTPLLVIYLCVIGEIVLHNCSLFFNMIDNMSHQLGKQASDILGKLLDIWLDKMDSMTRLERRKLTVLSLLSLLPINTEKCITDRFAIILDASVNVLHEIHRNEEGTHTDSLVLFIENEVEEGHSEEYKRKRKLCLSDPVHRYPLWMFVRDKLSQSQSVYGQEMFHQLMDCLDSAVAKQLFSFINH